MSDEPARQDLEDRIDELEQTVAKMLPGRRDALKLGGAALVGGAAMSGSASAGTQQVGTIGTANDPVDVESEDINNADTVTTQDLVVNGTATGPFSSAPVLESGDTITVEEINLGTSDGTFKTLFSGAAKDVLGGILAGPDSGDFLYTFDDNSTLHKNSGSNSFLSTNTSVHRDKSENISEVDFLPPAKNVKKIEVGFRSGNPDFGAEVILLD